MCVLLNSTVDGSKMYRSSLNTLLHTFLFLEFLSLSQSLKALIISHFEQKPLPNECNVNHCCPACSLMADTHPNHQGSHVQHKQRVSVLKLSMFPLHRTAGCRILVADISIHRIGCFTVTQHQKGDISLKLAP